jgi:hypothetical protein
MRSTKDAQHADLNPSKYNTFLPGGTPGSTAGETPAATL